MKHLRTEELYPHHRFKVVRRALALGVAVCISAPVAIGATLAFADEEGARDSAGHTVFTSIPDSGAAYVSAEGDPQDNVGETDDASDDADTADDSRDAADKDGSDDKAEDRIEVDLLSDNVKNARARQIAAGVNAYGMQIQADAVEAKVPGQQKRSDKAARELYKVQQSRYDAIDYVLGSQSIEEFFNNAEYLERITRANLDEIQRLKDLAEEAKTARAEADDVLSQAEADVKEAEENLKAAQRERAEKAENGIAKAKSDAKTLGGKRSLKDVVAREDDSEKSTSKDDSDKASSKEDESSGAETGRTKWRDIEKDDDKSAASSKTSAKNTEPVVEATTNTAALDDDANWYSTQEEFIGEWAPRIDAYLEGSPLAGQGENFAKSAWKWCIDPRWSAAISNTESSKGSFCIRPHNAWGWGAADSDPYNLASEWKSWEEAIDAHARGLAEGYGYTITMSGAKKYCPYTWQSWYNRTLGEMAKI